MDFTTKNRGTRTSLKEFQKDLLQEGLLRLRPFYKKTLKGVSLEDFIKQFLNDHNCNDEIETIFVDSEEYQCDSGLRRSGGDIFRICKYYYPKCTLEEVLTILDRLVSTEAQIGDNSDETGFIKSNICREINKRVFIGFECPTTSHYKEKDEFNRCIGEYNGNVIQVSELEVDDEDNVEF